ncbi:MAG: hypothetical protein K9H64_16275 [Bacteroidales bacterium]|nr:hypothetical protein [Bacteroidales bacterium]MCF8457526.1 hypothetical protein [Bacteroidales bacterium]
MNLAQLKYLIIDKIYDIDDESFLLDLKSRLDDKPPGKVKIKMSKEDEEKLVSRKATKN